MTQWFEKYHYWTKRIWLYLCRCRYVHGFGIQSPTAYHFLRYVINEPYAYYAYSDLKERFPHESRLRYKLCELYFRLSNFAQASQWAVCLPHQNLYESYIQAGCHHSKVANCINGKEEGQVAISDVLLMTLDNCWQTMFEAFANHAGSLSILIVEDIHATKDTRQIWHQMLDDPRTVVTFDLYYCGIIFFDHSKNEQHYMVHF